MCVQRLGAEPSLGARSSPVVSCEFFGQRKFPCRKLAADVNFGYGLIPQQRRYVALGEPARFGFGMFVVGGLCFGPSTANDARSTAAPVTTSMYRRGASDDANSGTAWRPGGTEHAGCGTVNDCKFKVGSCKRGPEESCACRATWVQAELSRSLERGAMRSGSRLKLGRPDIAKVAPHEQIFECSESYIGDPQERILEVPDVDRSMFPAAKNAFHS